MPQAKHHGPYVRLAVMAALSFAAMYLLMYAMVNRVADVQPSLNQAWMAGLMAAPMVLIELAVMGAMYPDRRLNLILGGAGLVAMAACFVFIRLQVGISDRGFVHSMVPHHSGAILMCREARLRDPELKDLCRDIAAGQQAEIDQMNAVLKRLDRRG